MILALRDETASRSLQHLLHAHPGRASVLATVASFASLLAHQAPPRADVLLIDLELTVGKRLALQAFAETYRLVAE